MSDINNLFDTIKSEILSNSSFNDKMYIKIYNNELSTGEVFYSIDETFSDDNDKLEFKLNGDNLIFNFEETNSDDFTPLDITNLNNQLSKRNIHICFFYMSRKHLVGK